MDTGGLYRFSITTVSLHLSLSRPSGLEETSLLDVNTPLLRQRPHPRPRELVMGIPKPVLFCYLGEGAERREGEPGSACHVYSCAYDGISTVAHGLNFCLLC